VVGGSLRFAFETKRLRSICEDSAVASSQLGRQSALSLMSRLADMRAAENPTQLPGALFCLNDSDMSLRTKLAGGYELVCTVNHVKIPKNESGSMDWHRVTRIKIRGVHHVTN
jgi:hypothetical protein